MSVTILARECFAPALQWLDLLLYRQILRLRARYQLSLDEFRGLYISDQQVDELILREAELGQLDLGEVDAKAAALETDARAALTADSAWSWLARLYRLAHFEQDVLLLCLAPELASKYAVLYAYLNNDVTRKHASTELALQLFASAETATEARRRVAVQSTLVGQGLVHTHAPSGEHSTLGTALTLAAPLRELLLGHSAYDSAFATFCQPHLRSWQPWSDWPFEGSVRKAFAALSAGLREGKGPRLFVIEATATSGAMALCGNVLAESGLAAWQLDASLLNAERDHAELMRRLCQSALFDGAGLVLHDVTSGGEPHSRLVSQGLLRQLQQLWQHFSAPLPCFLVVSPGARWRELCGELPYLHIKLSEPGLLEREGLWRWHLARHGFKADEQAIAAVADYFHLDWQQVQAAAASLATPHDETVSREALFAAAKQQSHGELNTLASRVDKPYCVDDLVLPSAIQSRVQEIIAAIDARRRVFEEWGLRRQLGGGCGLVALFGGASGTGKTMTAGVIANAIGLDLYRVELAGVVSKYIGETEKNLDRIFDAARQSNCILLLDEADALFGKRTEVGDAHDRYANIEVAYLLQKLESHDGIVILTTNLAKNIDAAFTRRLQFIIEFPRPDVGMRERLWRNMLSGGVPLGEDIDFSFLARQFDNTGGDIRNMVLDAALMAAAGGQVVDMALLLRAAARQMMKQGKVPSAVEFKHYFSLVDKRGG